MSSTNRMTAVLHAHAAALADPQSDNLVELISIQTSAIAELLLDVDSLNLRIRGYEADMAGMERQRADLEAELQSFKDKRDNPFV